MGCEGCARAILLVFNIIFFLAGAAALGVGIWVAVDASIFLDVLENVPNSSAYGRLISDAAYIIIAGGAFIFLVAFLGCCGAWKKVKCLLITYAVIIGILLLLEIGVVIVGYFFYDKVAGILKGELSQALSSNATYQSTFTRVGSTNEWEYVSDDILSKGIDALQLKFECCGVNNYTDYSNVAVPVTCCLPETGGLTLNQLVNKLWDGEMSSVTVANAACPTNTSYVESVPGCYDALYNYVTARSIIFIGIAGGTAGLQLLLIVFACCLCCAIRNEEDKA